MDMEKAVKRRKEECLYSYTTQKQLKDKGGDKKAIQYFLHLAIPKPF